MRGRPRARSRQNTHTCTDVAGCWKAVAPALPCLLWFLCAALGCPFCFPSRSRLSPPIHAPTPTHANTPCAHRTRRHPLPMPPPTSHPLLADPLCSTAPPTQGRGWWCPAPSPWARCRTSTRRCCCCPARRAVFSPATSRASLAARALRAVVRPGGWGLGAGGWCAGGVSTSVHVGWGAARRARGRVSCRTPVFFAPGCVRVPAPAGVCRALERLSNHAIIKELKGCPAYVSHPCLRVRAFRRVPNPRHAETPPSPLAQSLARSRMKVHL